jgi:hypothetical protein
MARATRRGVESMLVIDVLPPIRTDSRYEFRCLASGDRPGPLERLRRGAALLRGRRSGSRPVIRFGFRAANYAIRHHELWDAVYPLMFLTRNGGPLFNARDRATIRFRYPLPRAVRDFYVRRAANFGLDVTVEGETIEPVYDCPTEGHVLAFGGGKDSRLILGVLREAGCHPLPVSAGAEYAVDVGEARITEPVSGVLADRVMPALMELGRHFYFGSGLGEAHRETPWHQYFDWGSPRALTEFSQLLASLGVTMHAHAPASMLPYNIIQRILFERYPELYAYQRSVAKDEPTEKNLHVSLCEIRHGIPFHRHCDEGLFQELLDRFVRQQIAEPLDFGYRNHREVINREMRAIIHRLRAEPLFARVRSRIPASWEGPWSDYIHPYVAPETPPEFLRIYSLYAATVDTAPLGVPIWRIRV